MNLTKRILVLALVTATAFSSVFLLPEVAPMRESRLARHLPKSIGSWTGKDVIIGERELQVLANDTGFERKSFIRPDDAATRQSPDANSVEVSIVFSGKDLNNSIHRPETCLMTQGWEFVRLRYLNLPGVGSDRGIPVKEMLCRRLRLGNDGKPVMSPLGKPIEDWQLLYYTFIGHTDITPGHYSRTFRDIRDRVVGGYDQTWAYATFSTLVTGKYAEQGFELGLTPARDIDQTGHYLAGFMGELLPKVLAPEPGQNGAATAAR
jgi:hypothetical protein